MRLIALVLLAATACTAAAPEATPPVEEPAHKPAAERTTGFDPGREPPIAGFNADHVREWVRRHVAARLGPDAVRIAEAAEASVMATFIQGLPRPIQNADGSWGYEPPATNALVRERGGWLGWTGRERTTVSAAKAAEIERILADPAFWRERDYVAPSCTDAGAMRLVVRYRGRSVARQQSCSPVGLTGRLWRLVLEGPS